MTDFKKAGDKIKEVKKARQQQIKSKINFHKAFPTIQDRLTTENGKMEITEYQKGKADYDGCIEVKDGVNLCSQEYMLESQKDWHEEDESKVIDLTTSPYWLFTDDGVVEPIN